MKRIGAFSLAIFIFVLSVFSVVPVNVRADVDKTVIPLVEGHFGLTESDAQSKVAAHKDIYYDNDQRAFAYTPSSSYNWTLCNSHGAITSTHLSDKQVVALLCSSNRWEHNRTLISSFVSNNNIFRGFMSGVGSLFTGDSDNGTKFLDIVTGNYNYLDSLDYDEDSQTITMSNDNGSVDKLREEIRQYYYDYIGMCFLVPSGTVKELVDSSNFRALFEYEEDYNNAYAVNSKYAFSRSGSMTFFANDDFSDYYYLGNSSDDEIQVQWKPARKLYKYNSSGTSDFTLSHCYYPYSWNEKYTVDSSMDIPIWLVYDTTGFNGESTSFYHYFLYRFDCIVGNGQDSNISYVRFYSADNKTFKFFKSYSALYNYIHGDQNAYLSSKIEETGKDISYSIKDMNENLGNKMDELIDSINSGKGNMSADELQNAIDKGLEDLNKNTEDIKDNTSSILDKLEEQNQILLQILGVTEYIAYSTTKDDGSSYTKTDLTNTINKIYNGLGNAILYGKNTLTDSGDNSGAASQSSIVTREDFKLSNNIYTSSGSGISPGTPVVAYSLADYSVYDDSNDYDVGIATQDINNMDIHDGLFGKFPFSVPYQLYEWLQVLQADPVAPKLVYNYGFLLGYKDDQKYDLVIDFSIYEPWANVCKSFLRLSFTLLMAVFIFRHFSNNKGGGVL